MIGRELLSSESPSGVFSKALKLLKKNDQVRAYNDVRGLIHRLYQFSRDDGCPYLQTVSYMVKHITDSLDNGPFSITDLLQIPV